MAIKARSAFRRLLLAGLVLLIAACAGATGDVVKVTKVSEDPLKGLKQEDRAELEKLKKTLTTGKPVDELSDLLQKTPSFTVSQYLARHPDVRSQMDYKVGGYDILNILVYEEKDLSREGIPVSADGFITFPLIDRVRVADLTPSEIEKLIATKLAEGQFLHNAHVSVIVTKYESRKYSVLGAVKNPGQFSLQAQDRVLDGISRAGGIEVAEGEKQEAMIIRTQNPGTPQERKIVITIDLPGLLKGRDQISNILLAELDVLYIPKADYFYIMGEVKSPGQYAFSKKDMTIVEAISMAGGFTPIAASNKTRIVRIEGGAEKIYQVNVDAITKGGKMIQSVPIKPNDLIVVPESFF